MIELKNPAEFRRRLLAWFRRERRDLPWRKTRDAYRVWMSEVMLQQTRVAAVLPYYRRFLRRFPTARALARAREEEVMRQWAGLGYYSRARNLHRAAKAIVAQHGGRFPKKLDETRALPGVGAYTAAAVLSIAYGQPLAALDGNVARVLARLGALRGDLRAPRRWNELQQTAESLLAPRVAGEWNQAMMELGATVCTPRAPRCEACPVARWCRARAAGAPERFPEKRRKRATERVTLAAAVLLDPRGRTLLVRRDAGLFSGMWQFPAVEVRRDAGRELRAHLRAMGNGHLPQRTRRTQRKTKIFLGDQNWEALPTARHSVTFRDITLAPYLARVERLPEVAGGRAERLAGVAALAISNATRKIAERAMQATHNPGGRAARPRTRGAASSAPTAGNQKTDER